MDPLILGSLIAIVTVMVLFSGVSVAAGLLIVASIFLLVFDGVRSLELMPEILFGKLDNFALLSIPMFIIMGAAISSTRRGQIYTNLLERWLTRIPGGLVISNLGACACFRPCLARHRQPVPPLAKWVSPKCAKRAIPMGWRQAQSPLVAHWGF